MVKGKKVALATLGGEELKNALLVATSFLERYRDAINALNVFPVPDGDTGTNMFLTMKDVNEAIARLPRPLEVSSVAEAMARGAVLGSRGNSGVILAQFLGGLARGFQGHDRIDGRVLAGAFLIASEAAYKAVPRPVEGTMLTVIREAARACQAKAARDGRNVVSVWEAALEAAKEAVAETPNLLPVLRQAGVVDAGGQGLAVLMEGALLYLKGEDLDAARIALAAPAPGGLVSVPSVGEEYLSAIEREHFGYCVQVLVEDHRLDVDTIRQSLTSMGDSVVVVGEPPLIKLHVHAPDPDPILTYARSLGTLSQVKVENIDWQHQEFQALHRGRRQAAALAVVAVAWGDGFARIFTQLGARAIVTCRETMNPSVQELLNAIQPTGAQRAIVLPNNANVIPVAHQLANVSPVPVHVIPSRNLPQGIAALLAFNPEEDLERNLQAMEQALAVPHVIEITRATRATRVDDVRVSRGDYIGFLDEKLVASGAELVKVLGQTLALASPGPENLLTLYWGANLQEQEAQRVAESIKQQYPGLEVEVVYGGQPLYQFIASVE